MNSSDSPRRLMTVDEIADYLVVPPSWVRAKVREGQIPHTRIGKHIRFTEAHLSDIVRGGESLQPSTARANL